jgi:hypothetical protein
MSQKATRDHHTLSATLSTTSRLSRCPSSISARSAHSARLLALLASPFLLTLISLLLSRQHRVYRCVRLRSVTPFCPIHLPSPLPCARPTMYTFFQDGFYYSSPNVAYLPPVPSFPNPPFTKLTQLEQPLWLSNEHPYLALLPISIRFSGSILFRFSFNRASVPVEVNPQHDKWALKSDLMTRWMSIENVLHWLIPTLHSRSRFGMQMRIAPIVSPRFSGYLLGYDDESSARAGAISSWDAFIPKFCELS